VKNVQPLCQTCGMAADAASLVFDVFDPERPSRWPRALDVDEFQRLFPEETELVEFKQGVSSLQDSMVAFSNTAGGVILAGVRDDGAIVGLPCTAAVVDKVQDQARNGHAVAPVTAAGLRVGDREITVIGVERLREGFAQTTNGRVLVRLGTRRVPLIGSALTRFMHERAASSFESAGTDVPLADADPSLVVAVAEQLGIARRSDLATRFAERGLCLRQHGEAMLTVAGALYLLDRPDHVLGKAYVELLRFPPGSETFDLRQQFTGPLNRQVVEVTRALMTHLGVDEVVLGLRRHELPRLPERVIREAVANAVVHRSYQQKGTPVRIEVHADRVDVISPGGLVAPVTVETMRDAFAARNNIVIAVLRRFHLAEDAGKGVDLIQDMMRDELLAAPTFEATEQQVSVRLPILSGTRPEERAWVREIVERGTIEERDRVLLVHARRGEVLTNQRARELLRTGRDGAMHALKRLVDAGLLERTGTRGGTRYQLARALAPPAGLRLTRDELRSLVLEMAAEGPVTNRQVRERTGLDRQDVLTLFDALVGDGQLVRVGERRGTRYVVPDDAP
jgi:ATP-dependent DNA helicase RecG